MAPENMHADGVFPEDAWTALFTPAALNRFAPRRGDAGDPAPVLEVHYSAADGKPSVALMLIAAESFNDWQTRRAILREIGGRCADQGWQVVAMVFASAAWMRSFSTEEEKRRARGSSPELAGHSQALCQRCRARCRHPVPPERSTPPDAARNLTLFECGDKLPVTARAEQRQDEQRFHPVLRETPGFSHGDMRRLPRSGNSRLGRAQFPLAQPQGLYRSQYTRYTLSRAEGTPATVLKRLGSGSAAILLFRVKGHSSNRATVTLA